MDLYHFVDRGQLRKLAVGASVVNRQALGEFVHAQEDTYAHSTKKGGRSFHYYGDWLVMENGGLAGHLFHAHDPDHTWSDIPKAMKMAKRVFQDMKGIYNDPYQAYPLLWDPAYDDLTSDPSWEAIKGDVEKFVLFQPNVVRRNGGFAEVATYGGYNKKIQLLDGSYKINPAYANPKHPVYPDEAGFKPGTYFHTEVMKGATGLRFNVGDFVTPLGN